MSKALKLLALSFALGVVLGSFVFGFVHCSSYQASILDRIKMGFISILLTPAFGGFPPTDGTGTVVLNAWPYIIPAWLLMLFVLTQLRKGPEQL
jgi:hypothetical protein